MFITSTVNAMSASGNDVPVVVLTYEEESCLVKLPFSYEDLKSLTMRVFGIKGSSTASFTFRTSTLDICQGRSVAIHESAWEPVRSLIAEIQVHISDSKDLAATKYIESGGADPIPLASKGHHDPFAIREDPHDEERSEDDYEDFLENKIEAGQIAAVSSLAGSAANSDDEHEFEGSVSNKSEVFEHHTDDDGDDAASIAAHHLKTEPALSDRMSQGLNEYIDKDLSDIGDASRPQTDGQPAERPIKEEQVYVIGVPVATSGGGVGSSQSQAQPDADDGALKYVVNIEYRPKNDESMFKTRGTYSVRKVLARACESFGLDFDRAHLKLIIGIDDEDGSELLSDCNNGDTMARAGAVANSKFIIAMDDD